MNKEKLLLLGCGIFKKEVRLLIKKNEWPVEAVFFDSSLHIDFEKLSSSLTHALDKFQGRDIVVLYGSCHPLMEKILAKAKTFRTLGQNCVDILLGQMLFDEELSKGAFFLFEDWARRWDTITEKTFGKNPEVVREIYQGDRKYLLCLRTPCSRDFKAEAEAVASMVGLPLRWMDVSLDHLESVLRDAITKKMKEME